jgi:predicted ATPase
LSRSVQGRNRITYISEAQVERLRHALCIGGKAKRLLDEIADLTVAIIKAETRRKEDADERTS